MKHLVFFTVFVVLTNQIFGENLTIITRSQWGAVTPNGTLEHFPVNPPPFVVVHHTETPPCPTLLKCKSRVKNIQDYHMNHNIWEDIGYNFLIGGDGAVYEGRGWGIIGAHAGGINSKSIGISLIGSYQNNKPPQEQLQVLKNLISYGVLNGYIDPNYKLIGHRQVRPTACPGDQLYNEIKTWPHYSATT